MKIVQNNRRNSGKIAQDAPYPSVASARVSELLAKCPAASETPLLKMDDLAKSVGLGAIWVKDERPRMGLGSFKALGAAYVIARDAVAIETDPGPGTLGSKVYVTASAGNHGLSVAAGAKVFGAKAVVYIAQTVPESFAERLKARGAQVVREGVDYAASMAGAQKAARDNGWKLLSDSSWEGYYDAPHQLMEGYLQMAAEAVAQCPQKPTHIFLQAGVGGLAGAVAAYARSAWGDAPKIIVVEPEFAPALQASIEAGACVFADGPESSMGRLDCKEPSLIALNGLARDADLFVTVSDSQVEETLETLNDHGLASTPSGAAGIALAIHTASHEALGLDENSRVFAILSEVED